jgi:hypothetical protein
MRLEKTSKYVLILLIGFEVANVNAHGRLNNPPGRSSAWRFGYNTPINYDDNGLNCGGRHQTYSYLSLLNLRILFWIIELAKISICFLISKQRHAVFAVTL